MAYIALGRARQQRPKAAIGFCRLHRCDGAVLQADQARERNGVANHRIKQHKFVTYETPAARSEQRRQGRFARARLPRHHQHPTVTLNGTRVEQQVPPPAERHL